MVAYYMYLNRFKLLPIEDSDTDEYMYICDGSVCPQASGLRAPQAEKLMLRVELAEDPGSNLIG
jgi:hypothetical protein